MTQGDRRTAGPIRRMTAWATVGLGVCSVLGLIGYLAWYDTGYGAGADTEQAAVTGYLDAMNTGDTTALDELIQSPKYDGPSAQQLIDSCGRREVNVDKIDYTNQVRPYLFDVRLLGHDRIGVHDEWITVTRVWKRWFVTVHDTQPGPDGRCVPPPAQGIGDNAAFPAVRRPHHPTG